MEISNKKMNKLLAAQTLLTKGDVAVIEKILEFQDVIDDIKETFGPRLSVIEKDMVDKLDSLKQEFADYVSSKDSEITQKMSMHTDVYSKINELDDKMEESSDNHEKMCLDMENMSKKCDDLVNELQSIKDNLPEEVDITELTDKISFLETITQEIKSSIKDITPIELRDKLESITEEKEKLSITAIKDLRKELDELRQMKSKPVFVGGGSSSGGRISMIYDLSPYLDGATKTFSLPSFWRVTGVLAGSAPIALRPTVDYTTDAGAMTITFTSQIEASTTLAAGQTVLVNYSE